MSLSVDFWTCLNYFIRGFFVGRSYYCITFPFSFFSNGLFLLYCLDSLSLSFILSVSQCSRLSLIASSVFYCWLTSMSLSFVISCRVRSTHFLHLVRCRNPNYPISSFLGQQQQKQKHHGYYSYVHILILRRNRMQQFCSCILPSLIKLSNSLLCIIWWHYISTNYRRGFKLTQCSRSLNYLVWLGLLGFMAYQPL